MHIHGQNCEKLSVLHDTGYSVVHGMPEILLPSAVHLEERLTPISQSVRPAVSQTVIRSSRQADRNTQFGPFFSGRLGSKQWGGQLLSDQAAVEW